MLVSRPKLGKSWLVLDVAIATAAGRFTLGELKPSPGDVLYLALEDGKRRLQRRMTRLLPTFSGTWPPRLTIATEWPRADQGGLADIEAVDCLERRRRDWSSSIRSRSSARCRTPRRQLYTDDYAAISDLQKLASKHNNAIVIVHHDRKSEADDVFDTVSGSLGLTGAADTILIMKRQGGAVTLHVRGRDIEEAEKALQFDKTTCRWTIIGEAADIRRSDERGRVLAALEDVAGGLGVSEIMAAGEFSNRNALDQLLFRMASDGDIERVKRGLYGLPGTRDGMVAAADAISLDQTSSKMSKKVRSDDKTLKLQGNGADLTDLTHLTVDRQDKKTAATPAASDPWADLGIPSFLDRRPVGERLGAPAISAGPNDDIGDIT